MATDGDQQGYESFERAWAWFFPWFFTVFPCFPFREVQTLGHFGLFLLALDMKEAAVH